MNADSNAAKIVATCKTMGLTDAQTIQALALQLALVTADLEQAKERMNYLERGWRKCENARRAAEVDIGRLETTLENYRKIRRGSSALDKVKAPDYLPEQI